MGARAERATARRFGADEAAVSEVVGYILTFTITVVLLVAALHTFATVQDYSRDLSAQAVLEDVANRVAFAVLESANAGQQLPTVEYNFTLALPTEVRGRPFSVEMNTTHVFVNDTSGAAASSSLLNAPGELVLCRGRSTTLSKGVCRVPGETPEMTVSYGSTKNALNADVRGVFFRKTG